MEKELMYQSICTDIVHCEAQKHILDLEIEKNLLVLNNLVKTKISKANSIEEVKFKLRKIIKSVDAYLSSSKLNKVNT